MIDFVAVAIRPIELICAIRAFLPVLRTLAQAVQSIPSGSAVKFATTSPLALLHSGCQRIHMGAARLVLVVAIPLKQ